LLPATSNTDCKNVVFIMNEVNEIEEEMDMWTKEFMKYFTVKKVKPATPRCGICKKLYSSKDDDGSGLCLQC